MRVTSLAQFEGVWAIDRHILDHRAGAEGRLTGTATFTPDGEGLTVHETGELRYAGQPPIRAERRYLWRERAGRVEVLFDDGRPFHAFPLDTATPEARHACDPDAYAVRYDFGAFPDWTARWRVTGPRKDYTMTTRYRRA